MVDSSFSRAVDVARVGASGMVVLLHVAAVDFHELGQQWWASNFYDAFTRSCVPIFLMISGALLLHKQEALPVFLSKRLWRVVPPLVFWSAFYMAWNSWNGEAYGTPVQWLLRWLSGPVTFHLWYLYAIVGIYLFVPFLRHMWQACSMAEKRLFLVIWLLVSAWPIVQEVLVSDVDAIDTWQLGAFFGYTGYLFLGAYVRDAIAPLLKREPLAWAPIVISALGFVVFSVLTMVATYVYSRQLNQPDPLFYDYLSPLVVGATVCAFYLLACLGAWAQRAAPIFQQLAACALGVYCVHIFVLDIVRTLTGLPGTGPSSWWTIPSTAVVVFFISLFSIMGLRRFSFWRKVT